MGTVCALNVAVIVRTWGVYAITAQGSAMRDVITLDITNASGIKQRQKVPAVLVWIKVLTMKVLTMKVLGQKVPGRKVPGQKVLTGKVPGRKVLRQKVLRQKVLRQKVLPRKGLLQKGTTHSGTPDGMGMDARISRARDSWH